MKILIAGDFVINQPYSIDKIDQDVIDLFQKSDYNIVNLEAPVTNSTNKILKTGPHLKADKDSTLSVLKTLEIDLVTLANNHIRDYDEEGVMDTLAFCNENSIATVGAGKNKEEASNVFYIDSPEGKIGIINVAENEWASATDNNAGANGMDLIDEVNKIQIAKSKSDLVFVIVHGGHEFYNFPSPRMQNQYRFYADQGADIVVGHHMHCISGFEVYKGTPIYYSLGNLVFTLNNTQNDWYIGLIVEIEIKDKKIMHRLHPISQQKESFRLRLLNDFVREETMDRIAKFNQIIVNEAALKEEWNQYVQLKSKSYLDMWSPLTFVPKRIRYFSAVLRRLNIYFLNKKGMSLFLNLQSCEAHSDMSKEVINKYLKK